MTQLLERAEQRATEIPMLSGDIDRIRDALESDAGIRWDGDTTSLPPVLMTGEMVRWAAPTACEFLGQRQRVMDTSLLRLLSRTLPHEKRHAPSWLIEMVLSAPLMAAPHQAVVEQSDPIEVEAASVISVLTEKLALSQEKIGDVVGVSRGTLHNWVKKDRVADPLVAERLIALDRAVTRMRSSLGRGLIAGWLRNGSPSPESLLQQDELVQFNECVEAFLAPSTVAAPSSAAMSEGEPPDFSAFARSFLSSPRTPLNPIRSDWQPTEDTGIGHAASIYEEDE